MKKWGSVAFAEGRVEISPALILMLAAFVLLDEGALLVYTLAAVSLHEGGHLAALYGLNCGISRVRLGLSGVEIARSPGRTLSYGQEIWVCAAGPLTGALAAVAAAQAARVTGDEGFYILSGANLVLTVINLLPVRQTDGGQILYFLLCLVAGPDAATRTLFSLTGIFGVATAALGAAVLVLTKKNATLLIVGLYILCGQKERDLTKRGK